MDNRFNNPNPHQKTGKFMLYISWVLILLAGYMVFDWYLNYQSGANRAKTMHTASGGVELHIPLSRGNKYEVFGQINGHNVKYLVDTGATSIAIPESIANNLELEKGMPIQISTASGATTAYLTKINTLNIGNDIILHNINATINPTMPGDTILLGMGALRQLEFTQTNDVLILKQY